MLNKMKMGPDRPARGLAMGILFAALSLPAIGEAAPSLQLFHVDLHNANRATLRKAIAKAGLSPTRVDEQYFCDEYGVNGQIKGASKLQVCYTANDHFASAKYTFPSFMDTELVGKVINLVSSKYGAPDAQSGSVDLGPVDAVWHEGNGMQVEVSRGWPDTTTYLDLVDTANEQKLHQEIASQKAQQNQQQAQQESNAF